MTSWCCSSHSGRPFRFLGLSVSLSGDGNTAGVDAYLKDVASRGFNGHQASAGVANWERLTCSNVRAVAVPGHSGRT